nr:5'-3' exonuclease family protein [Tanacetum cinerariifolium]
MRTFAYNMSQYYVKGVTRTGCDFSIILDVIKVHSREAPLEGSIPNMTSSCNYSRIKDATVGLNEAIQSGNKDDIEEFSKRTVKVPMLDGNAGTSPIQLDIEQKTALSSDACEILIFRKKDSGPSLGKRLSTTDDNIFDK